MIITNIYFRLILGTHVMLIGIVLLKIYFDKDNIWGSLYKIGEKGYNRSNFADHPNKIYSKIYIVIRHHSLVRRELNRFRGREIDTAGDAFFATFDGPARAIRCAGAIRDAMTSLGLTIRAGLHTGECEVMDKKVTGIAVHIGARVMSLAAPGEVLVSRTVKDLVAGSGLGFVERGVHTLKGVPGEWYLFAAEC